MWEAFNRWGGRAPLGILQPCYLALRNVNQPRARWLAHPQTLPTPYSVLGACGFLAWRHPRNRFPNGGADLSRPHRAVHRLGRRSISRVLAMVVLRYWAFRFLRRGPEAG